MFTGKAFKSSALVLGSWITLVGCTSRAFRAPNFSGNTISLPTDTATTSPIASTSPVITISPSPSASPSTSTLPTAPTCVAQANPTLVNNSVDDFGISLENAATARPNVSFTVTSSTPFSIANKVPSDAELFSFLSQSPDSGTFVTSINVQTALLAIRAGSITFNVVNAAGLTGSCTANITIRNVSSRPVYANLIFGVSGNPTGGSSDQLIYLEELTGYFWLMNTQGLYRRFGQIESSVNWSNPFAEDFSGDGRTDLIMRNPANGDWWAALSNGTQFSTQRIGDWRTTPAHTWSNITIDRPNNGPFIISATDENNFPWNSTLTRNWNRLTLSNITPVPASVTFQLVATNVVYGGNTVLRWDSSNVRNCVITGPNNSNISSSPTGTFTITNAIANRTYNITCQAFDGTRTASATLTVGTAPAVEVVFLIRPLPTLTQIDETTAIVNYNDTIRLHWNSTNATSCEVKQGSTVISASATSGNLNRTITATRVFSISCTGTAGTARPDHPLTVRPTSLLSTSVTLGIIDFGTVVVPNLSAAQNVILTNSSNAQASRITVSLPLDVIASYEPFAGGPDLCPSGTFELAGNARCLLRFQGNSGRGAGTLNDFINIRYNDGRVNSNLQNMTLAIGVRGEARAAPRCQGKGC